ncbi:exosome complex protein Rrp42 [Candidatus Woesearchaeota archaeon]|nr:exosome complex protein Rrp42 [Candidatus Woesearchaeota archaeon]
MEQENKDHLVKALDVDVRFDGRKKLQYRDITVESGVYKNAEGSAKVTIGGTEVLAGVKMEVREPYPDSPDEGTIMVGAELIPLSNPEFELGRPSIQAIELARVVDRGIRESGMIDFKKLCIKEGEKVWVVSIDIIPMNDEGNLFDASALAALVAVKNAVFPKLDGDKIDYSEKTKNKLPLNKEPISVTVLKIGKHFIVDPTITEEAKIDARLMVSFGEDETIHAMQKGGETPLTADDLKEMVKIAKTKSKELRKFV